MKVVVKDKERRLNFKDKQSYIDSVGKIMYEYAKDGLTPIYYSIQKIGSKYVIQFYLIKETQKLAYQRYKECMYPFRFGTIEGDILTNSAYARKRRLEHYPICIYRECESLN